MSEEPYLILRFEGITATVRDEFITVRLYAVWPHHTVNCGMVVMFHHAFAAIALRPPTSELIRSEVVMTEGTVEQYLESTIGTSTSAA